MSFDWPDNSSSPDGPDEHLFVPLDDELFERWCGEDVREDLAATFARYDGDDVERALRATGALFERVTSAYAVRRAFPPPPHGAARAQLDAVRGRS